uniref:(California timema) hypothetical protein n=1 Tax=Timema californicum TaxID=61474 RepID=A0A7R9J4D3_TIMCA|nr:unnamed protein product [Timema californicum]
MEVEDLFTDLADGRKLLKLLEIISGEKLGKPNNGKMRVHRVENVNKSLAFLHTKNSSVEPLAKQALLMNLLPNKLFL